MKEKLFCKECNKEIIGTYSSFVRWHLLKEHNINTQQYYDKYYKKSDEGICLCGKETTFKGLFGEDVGYRKYCSSKCQMNDDTFREKNDISNRMKLNVKKLKDGMMSKYGVDNASKLDFVKQKLSEKSRKNYNERSLKSKKTCLEKFGFEYASQNPNIKEKVKKTMDSRYGGFIIGSKASLVSTRNTNQKRYNCDYILGSNYHINKIKENQILYVESLIPKEFLLLSYKSPDQVVLHCSVCDNKFKSQLQFIRRRLSLGENICPLCNPIKQSSFLEKQIIQFFTENYDGFVILNDRKIIPPLEVDIYLPDLRLAFEFNGLYWHNELLVGKNYHLNKTKLCEEKGIHLIHIYEDDWLFKTDIVKSRILNLLGKTERKIYARQCKIKYVSSKDSKEFLIENHIQGNVNSKIRLGLYYKEELVSLMTFGNLRKNLGSTSKENSYELLRFCNKINSNVIGGANKLYNYFLSNTNPLQILSYADRSWTSMTKESLYDKLGFKLVGETIPNYYYVKHNCRENRFNYRKDVLVKEGYDLNKTEREIMFDRGYNRIYDSGSLKYIWRNDE